MADNQAKDIPTGFTPDSMMHWTEVADEFNFALVYADQCTLAKDKSLEWSSQSNGLLVSWVHGGKAIWSYNLALTVVSADLGYQQPQILNEHIISPAI
jgi:hypothetical protein